MSSTSKCLKTSRYFATDKKRDPCKKYTKMAYIILYLFHGRRKDFETVADMTLHNWIWEQGKVVLLIILFARALFISNKATPTMVPPPL